MKKIFLLFVAGALAMSACNNDASKENAEAPKTDTAVAEAKPAENTPPPAMPDSATMMKAWMDYMTPGESHKAMAAMTGKWASDGTFWMDPKKPPTNSKGTVEFKMVLGGRYQQAMHHSMMMGQQFEGIGTMAYDNAKKMFISTWIDNMGTGMMVMSGTWDDASKSFNMKGTMTDMMSGKDLKCRETMKMVDDKTMTMEMWGEMYPGSEEMKMMEIKYTKM
ncbi:MAG: DUF1579 domain-containing protein [Bacteroidetes bacterium]|nr:DUF1579 domain-containing protein [Bacteroidota bacterium]